MSVNNFSKVDGFSGARVEVEGQVPAALLTELARQFYADRDADRQLAREAISQMMAFGMAMVEAIKAENAERAERREAAERNARRERHEERMRNERNARRP